MKKIFDKMTDMQKFYTLAYVKGGLMTIGIGLTLQCVGKCVKCIKHDIDCIKKISKIESK